MGYEHACSRIDELEDLNSTFRRLLDEEREEARKIKLILLALIKAKGRIEIEDDLFQSINPYCDIIEQYHDDANRGLVLTFKKGS
jgi:hypothetical protein